MDAMKGKYRRKPVYYRVYHEPIQAAQYRGTTTYQDVAIMMGLPTSGNYMGKEVGHIVGAISEDEHCAGRPMLSAVVVSSVDGSIGGGFFKLARELGQLGPNDDKDAFLESEREAVYETWRRPIPTKRPNS